MMKLQLPVRASWSTLALLAFAGSGTVYAQDSQSPAQADQSGPVQSQGNASVGIADIVVTAQRIEETAQRAPIAIDVVDADELVRQAVTRPEDLAKSVPALSATNSGGPYSVFFVRGVGNSSLNAYSDPAIAFNYDGVYVGRPSSTSGVFYDLQRVEVLKGPQGTLYGRNATAGAINVIPNRPALGELGAGVVASYGNYDAINAQGYVNLPVGETSAFRVSGTMAKHDAWLNDGTGDQDEWGVRGQFLTEISPAIDVRIGADYSHQGGVGSYSTYLGNVTPTFGPTGFAGYQLNSTGFDPDNGILSPQSREYLASLFAPQAGRAGQVTEGMPYNDNSYWGINAELNADIGDGTLTVIPAYRKAKLDNLFTSGMSGAGTQEEDEQTSLEVRYAGNIGDRLDYILGGFLFRENIETSTYFSQFTIVPYQDFKTNTDSEAIFGKLTYEVAPGLELTAAGRYTWDSKSFDGQADVLALFCGNPGNQPPNACPDLPFIPLRDNAQDVRDFYADLGVPITPVPLFALPPQAGGSQTAPFLLDVPPLVIDESLDNKKFTYRLAAEYEFSPRNMVYASFETGYRSGGFAFARGLETYRPETLDAWTLGTKNRFLDNRLQVNVEGFYWKYKDQQFSQFGYDLGTPPTTVFLTRNIGQATIYGFDADVQALLSDFTTIGGQVQYLKSEYDSFNYFLPNQGLPPVTSCDYAPTTQSVNGSEIAVFAVDCSGKPALNSPKWSINMFVEQVVPVGDYRIKLHADGRYRSAAEIDANFSQFFKADEAFVANAAITFGPEDEAWFATAFVNNLTDERRLASTSLISSVNVQIGNYEPPRTYGLRLGYRFP
ncbi:TonB-dependent receptor [Altericroceibacterium endophyticum]|uniref:TonB-dependent receptor n=1 Tax=Altericroceibacterium endophyticum TaxID=1808508 RepID=A0A6I4T673_9SPHN|nr:TonB-dependent receptor [Altericroceibacterium endophyticum]MXO66406.1 TonB-dependent receptor [Altericroceibacterium endophyticum]